MAVAEAPGAAGQAGPSPIDRWTLGYLVLATAAVVARWPAGVGVWLLASHGLLAALALGAPRARRAGGPLGFFGEFYPLLATAALYTGIGLLNVAGGTSHDARVMAWEAALFGGQPSRDWIRAQPWPLLSWPLHLGYLSYYLILASAPLGLWLAGRRAAARRVTLLMMVTFYVCYAVFLLFPVAGPRYVFPPARNAASGVLPAVVTQRLLDRGAAWGTAFPSSHVAVSLVAGVAAGWGWRALGAALLPLSVLLTLGTVYGQLHYAVDALAGIALALVVLLLGRRWSPGGRLSG